MALPIIRHIDAWEDIHLAPQRDDGFRLLKTFRCQFQTDDGTDWFLTVPEGFVTDLASIPSIFRVAWRSWGWWTRAAIVHDVLYAFGAGTKEMADDLFSAVLDIDKPDPPEEGHEGDKDAMVAAVRIGGRGNFDDPRPPIVEVLSQEGYP